MAYRAPPPEADRGARRNKAEMAEPTAGGVPAIDIGTDAELILHEMLSRIARRRARRLAMRDGHPVATGGALRQLDDDD